jgi:hypothetical protein
MLATHETMGKKMNIEIITSFNQKYYDLIGKDSVRTWLENWPQELTLTCYTEEMSIPEHDRIKQIAYSELPEGYTRFQESDVKDRTKIFAKKGYCVIHALTTSKADWVVWLDADVLTTRAIDITLLKSVLPNNALSTYLGVRYSERPDGTVGNWLVPETGFFAVNRKHPAFATFVTEYARRYDEQDRSSLRRFYDNDVFGAALDKASTTVLDLCANLKKAYKTPLKHTVLGPYLHHYKAKHSKEWFDQERNQ